MRMIESDNHGGVPFRVFGNFSIAESCYIQETSHFNAVEFNIIKHLESYDEPIFKKRYFISRG